jgi:hypothetical protein
MFTDKINARIAQNIYSLKFAGLGSAWTHHSLALELLNFHHFQDTQMRFYQNDSTECCYHHR